MFELGDRRIQNSLEVGFLLALIELLKPFNDPFQLAMLNAPVPKGCSRQTVRTILALTHQFVQIADKLTGSDDSQPKAIPDRFGGFQQTLVTRNEKICLATDSLGQLSLIRLVAQGNGNRRPNRTNYVEGVGKLHEDLFPTSGMS